MGKKRLDLTRRKFMAVGSAAIAAPILKNMAGMVPDAKGAEKEKTYDFIDKKSCDLVVLGGGGSGMVAAVRAAQLSGKKVIVLEKDSVTGGGARGATGVRYFRSKWQAKHNEKDTLGEYGRKAMDEVYWRLEEKLVYNLLRGTGQFLDWIFEQYGEGVEDLFQPRGAMASEWPGPELNQQKSGKKMGLFVVDMMKEKAPNYGVEVLTKHPVADIEVKNGKIVAAIAKSEKGYVRVACKGCIMSIGSWINNEEIVKKYYPKFAGMTKYMAMESPHCSPNYTGDGIALAQKVGAFLDYDSFVIRLMGPMHMGATSSTFSAMANSSYIITVNLDGKRYCLEPVEHMGTFDSGVVQVDQPHGMSYDIFDENAIAAALKKQKSTSTAQGAAGGAPGGAAGGMPGGAAGAAGGMPGGVGAAGGAAGAAGGMPSGGMMMGRGGGIPDTMEAVRTDIKEAMGKSTNKSMFQADTLEELADKIGVNKKNFLETVKKYNEDCANGEDTEFFKDKDNMVPINKPPYYASLGTLGTDGAFGGILVNPDIQAYKAGGGVIEGLYVTGDFASGRHINRGGVKHQVINDLSWAFTSGFLAGTNAGKYLQSLG
jgi:fumarate reductase flavoprotein subunit